MPRSKDLLLIVLAVGMLLGMMLVGCSKKQPSQPTSASKATTLAVPTDEECRQFAESLEKAIAVGDGAVMNAMINWEVILEEATDGLDFPDKIWADLRKGFLDETQRSTGIAFQIADSAANGGSYHFLRLCTKADQKRAVFRLLTSESGVNYHELVLGRLPDGEVRIVDIYVYMAGEPFSTTIRRNFVPVAAEASKGILAKLTQAENDYVKHLDVIVRMARAQQSGRYQEVLDLYAGLPPSLKKEKNFLMMRLLAASKVDKSVYRRTLDTFAVHFPGDPSLDLLLIDKYSLAHEYDKALACIDRLDAALDGDPYLDFLRANVKLAQDDQEAARQFATRAIETDETLVKAYWVLVAMSLERKDFDETNRLFGLMEEKCGVQFADLAQLPTYAEYAKSPQYREWLNAHQPAPQ